MSECRRDDDTVDVCQKFGVDRQTPDISDEESLNEQVVTRLLSNCNGLVPGDITRAQQNEYDLEQVYSTCNVEKLPFNKISDDDDCNIEVTDAAEILTQVDNLLAEDESLSYQAEANDINVVTNYLLSASEYGCLEAVIKLLDRYPFLINHTDSDGYTPLHRAAGNNSDTKIVVELLKRGANIAATTNDGWQPLHCACHWFQADNVYLLLQAGADINACSHGGQTPLHLASQGQATARPILEMLLLNRHCNSQTVNNCNDTAYDIAARSGRNGYLFEVAESSINMTFKTFRTHTR